MIFKSTTTTTTTDVDTTVGSRYTSDSIRPRIRSDCDRFPPLYMRLIERATPLVEKIPFLVMSSERKFKLAARSAVARQEAFTPSLWSATISVHALSVEAQLFFLRRLTSPKSIIPSSFVSHAAMRAHTSASRVVGLARSARYASTSSGEHVAIISSGYHAQSVCGTSSLPRAPRQARGSRCHPRPSPRTQRAARRGARRAGGPARGT